MLRVDTLMLSETTDGSSVMTPVISPDDQGKYVLIEKNLLQEIIKRCFWMDTSNNVFREALEELGRMK